MYRFFRRLGTATATPLVTETGVSTSGRYAGHNAVETLIGASLNLTPCLRGGITDYSLSAALGIV